MRIQMQSPVGAVIEGLALTEIRSAHAGELRRMLAAHGVLVFPDQSVDDAGFTAFLRRLGTLTFTVGETPVDGHPELNVISNVGRAEPPRSAFHVDTSYVRHPPAYTALRAVTLPLAGGATLFSDQYGAYESLPAETRSQLASRTVRHVVTGISPDALGPGAEVAAEHPLLLEHPISRRTALYLTTPPRCAQVSGLSHTEGAALIARLYEHSTQEHNVYRHHWHPGDVVVWDNRCVMHRAEHDGVVGDRVLHRGVVNG